jgi:hypothetical protein
MTWMQDPDGNIHEIKNYLREVTLINSQGWKRLSAQEVREMSQKDRKSKLNQSDSAPTVRANDAGQQMINNAMYMAALDGSSSESSSTNDSCHGSHSHSSGDSGSHHSSHGHSSDHGYSSGHDYSSSHDYGSSFDSGSSGGDF